MLHRRSRHLRCVVAATIASLVVSAAAMPAVADFDYIGASPAVTQSIYLTSLVNSTNPTGQFFVAAQPWTPASSRVTRELWTVYGQNGMNLSNVIEWRVAVWNSLPAFTAAPKTGNVLNVTVATPPMGSITTPYGQTSGGFATYRFGFTLPPTLLQAGTTYYFAIFCVSPYPANGLGGTMESSVPTTSGVQAGANSFFRFTSAASGIQWSGGLALKLISSRVGDTDCNGVIELADATAFTQALLDPAGYAVDHPSCPIKSADLNRDGTVDGADIQQFVNCILNNSCP